ncbi:metallo-beta-lactamase family protein [Parasphingorhabdus marina DSM 22363]|uniref:Metallo-beta-lactamase family protein n=1 Tax=Parasphingorhabdus marina DSM 22363 TaxID=1123272 RepID=A0A1N6CQB8_9SPHN|nr:MBL fold metallo-hydrolase [Parasphingorhabdus marina]SIN60768.1 metallo-beta-lactamase family protein [Parasphingorhabdus marina DSM 22363]
MGGVTIAFHGAAGTVTGSCFEIRGAGKTILVDCGMFQGTRSLEKLNYERLPFDPRELDAIILTHAHLDHSGRLPKLYAERCKAPCFCTRATADILKPLLQDSAKLQAASAERRNRRADRAGLPRFSPLYGGPDITALYRKIRTAEYCEQMDLGNRVSIRFWDARHIVGSASAEITVAGQRILVSGDIGSGASVPCPDVELGGYDHIICESTYGDRDREDILISDRREALARYVEETISNGGNLLIPAFAVERTQVILEDLSALFDSRRLSPVNVFLDAPLAQKVTEAILHYRNSGLDVMKRRNIRFIQSVNESKRLNRMTGIVIVAGSGMCEGGRIRHHLVRNLPDRRARILFTGFQAAGTLGSVLRDGAEAVRISGNDVVVNARITSLDGYSNHADRSGLLHWVRDRSPVTGTLFLVHGEASSLKSLAGEMSAAGIAPDVAIPALGETWNLEPARAASRLRSARPDAEKLVASRDWTSRLAALRASMEHRIRSLESDRDREKMLEALKRALDERV